MEGIEGLLKEYGGSHFALYGLGTETERFLYDYGRQISIVGLLDGFRESGEMYGYPIIPLWETIDKDVAVVIVIARPGSCKAIVRRIGEFCKENNIALFDVRGRNLLEKLHISFDFKALSGISRGLLWESIEIADVVSFDLFDTLIAREVLFYTDIFDLLDIRLRERSIFIPNFAKLRVYVEKELSKRYAPTLEDIYKNVLKLSGGNFISAAELAQMEYEMDMDTFIRRSDICEVFRIAISEGKKVVITTDSYYSADQIKAILERFDLRGTDAVLVSSDKGTSKTQQLFGVLKAAYQGKKLLHIGNDEVADVEKAEDFGIDTCRIYSGADLFDYLGGIGLKEEIKGVSARVKVGMFIANIFNSPFWFEGEDHRLSVNSAYQIGFSFCAPMITDFVLWIKRQTEIQGYGQILFCSRDGYLPGKLFKEVSPDKKAVYFLSSRTAAIRAGMENHMDIEYVDSMKYFGSREDALEIRFGILTNDTEKIECEKEILHKADIQRKNYRKYIENLDIQSGRIGMFDFVAKGTTQIYLQKIFSQHLKGFYFLQLEPEFMSDKALDIEPFFTQKEKDVSAIFDNYYILETILTSPYAQVEEFDKNGTPVFAEETRSDRDIRVVERAQAGIIDFFYKYLKLVPESARSADKMLDEKILSIMNKIQIKDDDFLKLKVEDPFFGRMTDIRDVIG